MIFSHPEQQYSVQAESPCARIIHIVCNKKTEAIAHDPLLHHRRNKKDGNKKFIQPDQGCKQDVLKLHLELNIENADEEEMQDVAAYK